MKPPFAYYGGKQQLADRIAATFPAHGHYVEPFAGSLAVLLAKQPAPHETVNDLDDRLVTFWRVLRDQSEELMRLCALTPHSRSELSHAHEPCSDEVESARRTWVELTQGRGGTLRRTGWRQYIAPSGVTGMPRYLDGYLGRMPPAVERLRGVSLECRPALEIVKQFGAHADVLLYVDPPYLGSTRSSRQYRVEMSHEHEHRELAEALLACEAMVVLSGYRSELYDEMYQGWHLTELSAFTGQANTAGVRTEVLWSNRAPHPTLFAMEA